MAVAVGKAAWERQQERTRLADEIRRLPSLPASKVLSLASQMTPVIHQLACGGVEDVANDADCLKAVLNLDSSNAEATAALAVCMLLRAGCQWDDTETTPRELGIWHSWSAPLERVVKVLRVLGWHAWLPLLVPWLPRWQKVVNSLQPLCSQPSDPLRGFFVAALTFQVSDTLQRDVESAAASMRALDDALLATPLAVAAEFEFSTVASLEGLLPRIDAAIDDHLAAKSDATPLKASEGAFQALCQLRARISLSIAAVGGLDALKRPPASGNASESLSGVDAALQSVLTLGAPCSSSNSTPREATALAAHAAVAALFGDNLEAAANLGSVRNDPNPVAPGRVAWATLSMLQQACSSAGDIQSSFLCTGPTGGVNAVLARLCWAAAGAVERRDQQRALLQLALVSPEFSQFRHAMEFSSHFGAFEAWARHEVVALSNRLRSAASKEVETFGEREASVDSAVTAVFPAALLRPAAVVESLVGGAVGQLGQATLLAGILMELPPLAKVERIAWKDSRPLSSLPCPRVVSLLADRLASSGNLPAEGDTRCLEECVLALCCSKDCRSSSAASHQQQQQQQQRKKKRLEKVFVGDARGLSAPLPVAISSRHVLTHAVIPVLGEPDADVALLLRVARRLLEADRAEGSAASVGAFLFPVERSVAGTSAELAEGAPGVALLASALPLLRFDARRIDLAPQGLETSLETLEEAQKFAFLCRHLAEELPLRPSALVAALVASGVPEHAIEYITPSTALPLPPRDGSTVWQRGAAVSAILQRYAAGTATAGTLQRFCSEVHRLSALREALLWACAVTLPCCTPQEVSAALGGVREAVAWLLQQPTLLRSDATKVSSGARGNITALQSTSPPLLLSSVAVEGAVIEVICRAVHAVALVPGLIPVAGEPLPLLPGPNSPPVAPSAHRALAASRLAQHLSLRCQAAVEGAPSGAPRAALAARALLEVCRCSAAVVGACSAAPLAVCALHLAQVLKGLGPAALGSEVIAALKTAAGELEGLGDGSTAAAAVQALLLSASHEG